MERKLKFHTCSFRKIFLCTKVRNNYNHCQNILRKFCFSKLSFHHKWNEAWLLVINWYVGVTLRAAEQLKILGNYVSSEQRQNVM